jgi:hypothetical protein
MNSVFFPVAIHPIFALQCPRLRDMGVTNMFNEAQGFLSMFFLHACFVASSCGLSELEATFQLACISATIGCQNLSDV